MATTTTTTETKYKELELLDIDDTTYHSIKRFSSSELIAFKNASSPKHFLCHWGHKAPSKDQALGSIIHCAILQPEVFNKNYVVLPDKKLLSTIYKVAIQNIKDETKEGAEKLKGDKEGLKKFKDEQKARVDKLEKEFDDALLKFQKDNEGKSLVDADDYETARKCAQAVKDNGAAFALLKGAITERAMFFNFMGLPAKCKIDAVNLEKQIIIDVKTTRAAGPQGFLKSILEYSYHMQAAFYAHAMSRFSINRGLSVNEIDFEYYILAIEKFAPYEICLHKLDKPILQVGKTEIEYYFQKYKACIEKQTFPGYSKQSNLINFLPDWYLMQLQQTLEKED